MTVALLWPLCCWITSVPGNRLIFTVAVFGFPVWTTIARLLPCLTSVRTTPLSPAVSELGNTTNANARYRACIFVTSGASPGPRTAISGCPGSYRSPMMEHPSPLHDDRRVCPGADLGDVRRGVAAGLGNSN